MMDAISRVQTYLRHRATESMGCHSCQPFSVFTNPNEQQSSFAIPDMPVDKAISQVITELQVYANKRNIPARIQAIEEYTPEFIAALRQAGFGEVWRQPVMIVTPQTLIEPEPIPGLSFVTLSSQSSWEDVTEGWITNSLAFDEDPVEDDHLIEKFRRELATARAFTAKVDGVPAAACMFADVRKNVTEIVGVGTVAAFRRKGIAAAMSAFAVKTAFDMGVDMVFLTTESEAAARVYDRIGFKTAGWLIQLSDNQAEVA